MRTYNAEVWAEIMQRGALNIPAARDCSVDVRKGLPSLTLVGYPDSFSLRVVEYLREWGWLLPYRMTVYVPRTLRSGRTNAPSMQSVASYVQSALLNAERVYALENDS